MVITDAKYTRRFKTGEYEFEEFTLGANLEEGDNEVETLKQMKESVKEAYTDEVTKPAKQDKKGKSLGKSKPKANNTDNEDADDEDSADEDAGNDGESDQDNEAADGEDRDDSDDNSEDGEDGEEQESRVSEKDKLKGKGKPAAGKAKTEAKENGKKFKKKPQSYNRGIEQHKEIFSGLLRSIAPDWKKNEASKALGRKASEAMEGEEFLDENGEVLPEFKAAVKKLMSPKKK